MGNLCYFTPVPSRRISTNGKVEFRLATSSAVSVSVSAKFSDGTQKIIGEFPLKQNLKLTKIHPDTTGLIGEFDWILEFRDASGNVIDTQIQNYEIVKSDVHSTRLLDGCWISVRHWSPVESRYFKDGLEQMTDDDWKEHIYQMHKAGITTVLIQNMFDTDFPHYHVNEHPMTADTYEGEAYYDSAVYPRRRENMKEKDPLEAILTAADECGMAVWPGVGIYAMFDFSPDSLLWHKRVAKEYIELYGHHKSFYGFYISEEIFGYLYYDCPYAPDELYKDIQSFFREFRVFAHELAPTKPVALAPSNIDMHKYPTEWGGILENLDIIIPFGFARSPNNVAEIIEMCKNYDTHFWCDLEIFRFPFDNGALVPKDIDALIKEIRDYDALEQIYGYQFTGLMNEPGKNKYNLGKKDTEDLFAGYYKYQKKVRDLNE